MPKAVRAVGHANGANPLSVVVPCHRLIGANGSLVKYGGGLERKRWLLQARGRECVGASCRRMGGAKRNPSRTSSRIDGFRFALPHRYKLADHAAGCATLSSLASRWISALLIAACRVGALIWAPSRSVT